MENNIEQRSDAWFNQRIGRFTGSQIHKLMGIKGLGLTGETYCFENACDIVFGRNEDEQFVSFDMQRGIALEPVAFRKFAELKELEFLTVETCEFFPFENNGGASPDGIVSDKAVLEIKCPRPNKVFNLIAKGVEAIDKEYILQMQMEMLVTNSTHAYFFNYCIFNGAEMYHEIVIQRDDKMIELIKERILQAVIIRDDFVDLLRDRIQYKPSKNDTI